MSETKNGSDIMKFRVALAGNPNVGKSTVFNALTGMKQHTGNWAGKTVSCAEGVFTAKDAQFTLVDIPGTYSLRGGSAEEICARDFLCFGESHMAVVVCDATCLERNLILALQIAEAVPKTLICVNLLDEARAKDIEIDLELLEKLTGATVAGVSARNGEGLEALAEKIYSLAVSEEKCTPLKIALPEKEEGIVSELEGLIEENQSPVSLRVASLRLLEGDADFIEKAKEHGVYSDEALKFAEECDIVPQEFSDTVISSVINRAESICAQVVFCRHEEAVRRKNEKLDRFFAGRKTGIPVMIILFCLILWITVAGANYPSELLSKGLFSLGELLSDALTATGAPQWLKGLLIDGIYTVLAWVISVMLPPMAIFFPLFTLLEDSGYLPRVAFNLDRGFACANACGKQAITMAMGLGCNACGVTGCRIIDSPRERLMAILTNCFMPCNGRFPTIIMLITVFFVPAEGFKGSVLSALCLLGVIILGVVMTFAVSKLLSLTLLKGQSSSFTLELPPYRRPQIGKVLVRSLLDRTVFVLGRACIASVPCGLIIWLLANITVGGAPVISHLAEFLHPFATLMGLDGVILLGFILGFPANEIVLPIIVMTYLSQSSLSQIPDTAQLAELLSSDGRTATTALCMIVFSLFHFPCATTCLTIKKETASLKWTAMGFILPTAVGILLCMMINFADTLLRAVTA